MNSLTSSRCSQLEVGRPEKAPAHFGCERHNWHSADAWRLLGAQRLFYAVSAGAMDSMINHDTANRKRRNRNAYAPARQG
jgi:hypothetical protein